MLEKIDRMKTDATDISLLAVGSSSFLIPDRMAGISEVVRVEHHAVANAVGAVIAQVSREVDQILFTGLTRAETISRAKTEAAGCAIEAGAGPRSLRTLEVEDIPISYLRDERGIRVRLIGDIQAPRTVAATDAHHATAS